MIFLEVFLLDQTFSMRIRVLYHDHCFDGAASAAFFTRFLEDKLHPGAEFLFTGMAHKPSQIFEDELFDGDENAIVDFKYSTNPKLTWWFDHHQSAFLSAGRRRTLSSGRGTRRSSTIRVSGPAPRSFAQWAAADGVIMRRILRNWCIGPRSSTGLCIADAKEAVDLGAPAMQLTLVIEGSKGSDMVQKIIRWMRGHAIGRNHAAA